MSKPVTSRTDTADDAAVIQPIGIAVPSGAPDGEREALEVLAFLAVLQNPRVEQLARLTSADPAVQGAELHAYTRRLVAGYRAAQQEARP